MFGYGKTGFDDVDELLRAYEKQQRRETIKIISGLIYECFDMFFGCVFRSIISIFKGGRTGLFKRLIRFLGEILFNAIIGPFILFALCRANIIAMILVVTFFSSFAALAILGSGLVWIPAGIYIYFVLFMTSDENRQGRHRSTYEKTDTDNFEEFNETHEKFNKTHEKFNETHEESNESHKGSNETHSEGPAREYRVPDNIFWGLDMMQAKTRYRELMKQVHPDNGGSSEEASDITRQFREYVMKVK